MSKNRTKTGKNAPKTVIFDDFGDDFRLYAQMPTFFIYYMRNENYIVYK